MRTGIKNSAQEFSSTLILVTVVCIFPSGEKRGWHSALQRTHRVLKGNTYCGSSLRLWLLRVLSELFSRMQKHHTLEIWFGEVKFFFLRRSRQSQSSTFFPPPPPPPPPLFRLVGGHSDGVGVMKRRFGFFSLLCSLIHKCLKFKKYKDWRLFSEWCLCIKSAYKNKKRNKFIQDALEDKGAPDPTSWSGASSVSLQRKLSSAQHPAAGPQLTAL